MRDEFKAGDRVVLQDTYGQSGLDSLAPVWLDREGTVKGRNGYMEYAVGGVWYDVNVDGDGSFPLPVREEEMRHV